MPRIWFSPSHCVLPPRAVGQEAYPSKPVTDGGGRFRLARRRIVGRPLAAGMHHALKQPVVVINRTGAAASRHGVPWQGSSDATRS